MFRLFDKKKKPETEDGVIVVRKPEPNACGGTTETRDTRAPKTIVSEEMILFDVTSALPVSGLSVRLCRPLRRGDLSPARDGRGLPAPCGKDSFLGARAGERLSRARPFDKRAGSCGG